MSWTHWINFLPLTVCTGEGQADQSEEWLVSGLDNNSSSNTTTKILLSNFFFRQCIFSHSESNSANVCQLHLELEQNLSFSFVQHEVEEEEEREKAENIRWYVVELHTSCAYFTCSSCVGVGFHLLPSTVKKRELGKLGRVNWPQRWEWGY